MNSREFWISKISHAIELSSNPHHASLGVYVVKKGHQIYFELPADSVEASGRSLLKIIDPDVLVIAAEVHPSDDSPVVHLQSILWSSIYGVSWMGYLREDKSVSQTFDYLLEKNA